MQKKSKPNAVARGSRAQGMDTSAWVKLLGHGTAPRPDNAADVARTPLHSGYSAAPASGKQEEESSGGSSSCDGTANWAALLARGKSGGPSAPLDSVDAGKRKRASPPCAVPGNRINVAVSDAKRARMRAGEVGTASTANTPEASQSRQRAASQELLSKATVVGRPGSCSRQKEHPLTTKEGSKRSRKRKRSNEKNPGGASANIGNTPDNVITNWTTDASKGAQRPRGKKNILNLAHEAQKAAAKKLEQNKGNKRKNGTVEPPISAADKHQYVALDCEMVGVGPNGSRSALARCCLVDWDGNIIYDKYVKPAERVTDFRTFVSGVKAKDLKDGLSLRQCQDQVAEIIKERFLVGHALHNDLKALMMNHPARLKRDTAVYRPYQKAHGKSGGRLRPVSLKKLALERLGRTIQSGQHNPAEDARSAMDLYKLARVEWERSLTTDRKKGRRAVVDQHAR